MCHMMSSCFRCCCVVMLRMWCTVSISELLLLGIQSCLLALASSLSNKPLNLIVYAFLVIELLNMPFHLYFIHSITLNLV